MKKEKKEELSSEYKEGATDMLGCMVMGTALILIAIIVAKALGWA